MANFVNYESLTVADSSVGFTAATIVDRTKALVTVETAAVRFRLDGTAPTSSVGHILYPDDVLELDSEDQLTNIRFIRRDATSATLRCAFGSP